MAIYSDITRLSNHAKELVLFFGANGNTKFRHLMLNPGIFLLIVGIFRRVLVLIYLRQKMHHY